MTDVRRLPPPVSETWEWQQRGACRKAGAGDFFHRPGERGRSRSRREAAAKQVCAVCPVMSPCLAWAMTTHELYGVWGGLGEADRQKMLAAQARGCASGPAQ